MARIRTVKPKLFTHEGLYDAEHETGLPLRLAFIGLFTEADREGRFQWRPRTLKAAVLPFDDVDFSRVLDALATRGFLVKYASHAGEKLGLIPTFRLHQAINNKEPPSTLDAPSDDEIARALSLASQANANASITRQSRVNNASSRTLRKSRGEGKGKEGDKPKTLNPKTEGSNPSHRSNSRARANEGPTTGRDGMPLALRTIVEQRGLPLTPKLEDAIDAAAAEGVRPSTFGHAIDDAQARHGVKNFAAYALKTARQWHREGNEPPLVQANGHASAAPFDERAKDRKATIDALTGRNRRQAIVDDANVIDVPMPEVRDDTQSH